MRLPRFRLKTAYLTSVRAVGLPSGFPFTPPFNIKRVGAGPTSTFKTDYNPLDKRPTPTATIYVGIGGSNNNDGLTFATRVRSWSLAILMANALGGTVNIKFEGGSYLLTNSSARSGQTNLNATYIDGWNVFSVNSPTCNLVIEPYDGVSFAELIMNRAAPTWVATTDPNIWKCTTLTATNLGGEVADLSHLDPEGVPTGLFKVFTAADHTNPVSELNAAWGTYGIGARYWDATSSVLWVRLSDNRQPDANIRIHDAGTYAGFAAVATATRTIWMRNMRFRGGTYGFRTQANGASGFDVNEYYTDCAFTHSGSVNGQVGNVVHQNGGGEIIHLRSRTSYSVDDGIAHYDGGGRAPNFMEIDCVSRFNGMATSELTCNAFTSHGACQGIRINAIGLNALDRAIHDIGATQTWDLGSTSSNSRGPAGGVTSSCIAVGQDGQTAKKWIDAPRLANGAQGAAQYPTEAYSGCTLLYANCSSSPTAGPGTGTVQAYAA